MLLAGARTGPSAPSLATADPLSESGFHNIFVAA